MRCFSGTGTKENTLTLSKLMFILPTFVAPTGTMPKNPCLQRPRSATRSLSTNKFSKRLAMKGDTENNSPSFLVESMDD